jgi:type IV pilus assembly protein PilC
MVQNVASRKASKAKSKSKGFNFKEFEEKVNVALSSITVKDLAIFARQFAAMFSAGVPMVRCLSVLTEQCPNPKLKKALEQINAEVQEGGELSTAMRKHPDVFDNLFVSMVAAGEVGGVLDEVLNRLAVIMEKNAKLQNEIKSATSYPKTVTFIAVAAFLGMTRFLLPTFAGIFQEQGAELPQFTKMMLAISEFLQDPVKVGTAVGILLAAFIAYRQYYKTPAGKLTMDGIFLKLPLFGDLIQKTAVARFCTIFGTLTRSGVPILNALAIVAETAGNQVITNAVYNVREELQQGGEISIAIDKQNIFPPLAVQMMAIGEETGELDKMLMKVGEFYEDEVEQAVKGLTSAMEPIMIVGVGGVVVSVLLSMYLPMFKMFEHIQA